MEWMEVLWTTALVAFLGLVYYCYAQPFNHWKKSGIPYVTSLKVWGIIAVFRKPFHELMIDSRKKYGKLYGQYAMSAPMLTVANPDHLRDILVKDFQYFMNRNDFAFGNPIIENMVSALHDEKWKRVRTIITPAFTTGKIKKMTKIILESAKTLGENFSEAAKSREPVDALRFFDAFSMDVIASSAFATKIDSLNDPDNPFIHAARNSFPKGVSWKNLVIMVFPFLSKFLKMEFFGESAMAFFKKATLEIIEERKKTGQVRNDFLQLMMDASERMKNDVLSDVIEEEDEIGENEQNLVNLGHDENNKQVFKAKKYKGLTHDELVAQCVLFFMAGQATTSSALSFTAYLLAQNPGCQETLITEIDEGLRQNMNQLTYEGVQNMKYLDNVIWETLRIFPSSILLVRVATADYKLGDTGLIIPKGTNVMVPVYSMHHDPENFPEPEKFDPTRFDQDEKARRNPYTFLPFGAGPRNCLGMRFVLIEMKICLAYLLSQYRFHKCTEAPLEFYKGQGLMIPKELPLTIEKRSDAVCSF